MCVKTCVFSLRKKSVGGTSDAPYQPVLSGPPSAPYENFTRHWEEWDKMGWELKKNMNSVEIGEKLRKNGIRIGLKME